MLLKIQGIRKQLTIPTDILSDSRLSIGAKGLYVQLIYSNDNISSLEDLVGLTTNTEDELKEYFGELAKVGYIEMNNKQAKLKHNAPKEVENAEEKVKEAQEYAETTQPPKLSIYDKIKIIIDEYDLSQNVKNLLLVYFTDRLNKTGRFSEADDLHATTVRKMIGTLVSYHLSDDDQISCIQTSIDNQWFVFVKPEQKTVKTADAPRRSISFDRTDIKSGTYTEQDIENIKKRAEALGSEGVF